MKRKNSLAKDFKLFASILIILVFIISVVIGIILYYSQKETIKTQYEEQADHIGNFLTGAFNYVAHYSMFLGNKIIASKTHDVKYIAELLNIHSDQDIGKDNLYSWTLFDWITPEKKMIVSTKYGVLDPPIDMSLRSYLKETPKTPWKLVFSDPSFGIPSNEYIIPTGVGIIDKNNKFYGTIGTGFSVESIKNNIMNIIGDKGINFIVVNDNLKLVLSSTDTDNESFDMFFKRLTKSIKADQESMHFNKAIIFNNIGFYYVKKLEHYPFYIVVGMDRRMLMIKFLYDFIPRILELFFVAGVCIFLLYYSRKLLVNPIIKLSLFAKKIANNDLNIFIPILDYEEAEILASRLREIIDVRKQLLEAQEKIKKTNESLECTVKERTQELELALRAKGDFLNNMSHEIRTPIQGFNGIVSGLVEHWQSIGDKQKFEYVKQIANNSHRLYSLVSNLLDLSKLTSGKMILDLRKSDLNKLITSIIEECKNLYLSDKSIQINFLPEKIYKATFDQERIAQVLRNLLTNAIRFTGNSKIIEIKISDSEIVYGSVKKEKAVLVSIVDQGVGVPKEELESIFLPFVQSKRTKTKAGGTGLGLSISKEIIEAHNGKIWAENNEKKGTNFSFLIPLVQKDIRGVDEDSFNEVIDKGDKKLILIVDDEESCLMSVDLLLRGTGYNLIKAKNGHEALEFLNSGVKIDLIMLDLMMPDMYGLNVLEKIDPLSSKIPVILQSGSSDEQEIKKAFSMGVVDYIRKPYEKNSLLSKIKKYIESKKY